VLKGRWLDRRSWFGRPCPVRGAMLALSVMIPVVAFAWSNQAWKADRHPRHLRGAS